MSSATSLLRAWRYSCTDLLWLMKNKPNYPNFANINQPAKYSVGLLSSLMTFCNNQMSWRRTRKNWIKLRKRMRRMPGIRCTMHIGFPATCLNYSLVNSLLLRCKNVKKNCSIIIVNQQYGFNIWGATSENVPWTMRPTKTQISLRARAVWSESSLSAWRNVAPLAIQNAPGEDSDQTARMRRLIWIFAGRTCPKSYCGSYVNILTWSPV